MGKSEISRRNFIQKTVLGSACVLMPQAVVSAAGNDSEQKLPPIITRKLGNTGIVLPIVSFGVMRADSPALLQAAYKEGMVHFDTAHGYQNGKNEEMIGEIFKDIKRDTFVLSTKIVPEDADRQTGKIGPGTTSKAFLNKLDISLKRLKQDYVDILYVHALQSRDAVLHPELIAACEQAKKEGKAKHIGVSTHRNEPEVMRACIESKVFEVVLTSINYKQAHIAEVKKAIAECAKAGIGIVAMKTMAGGFQDKERKIPVNCSAALKYVLQDENVTTAIPGITNFDQLKENAAVNRDLVMTDKEKGDLALNDARTGGLYCQGCLNCVPDCPKGLPIPDLMRAYMYTYGYGDLSQARNLIDDLGIKDNPCRNCSECSVACVKEFNVAGRIADVVRVASIPEEFIV